jgi:2-keto-4-pentenoate hydratase/2-oxohepta-3-ene-1,7-dioic acid hydratase in catechol pathway
VHRPTCGHKKNQTLEVGALKSRNSKMPWFALAAYRKNRSVAPGIVIGSSLYDLRTAAKAARMAAQSAWFDLGVEEMLRDWRASSTALRKAAASMVSLAEAGKIPPVGKADKLAIAPYRPARMFCASANYTEHANEMATVLASKSKSKPYMFVKLQNSIIGPREAVRIPPETRKPDWEVELAAVIGRRARRVPLERALDFVAGYSVVNDVSARDLNSRTDYPFKFDWFQGKCHDTFAPFGPWIVPAWLIRDPQALRMSLTVNGKSMQDSSTANMIWSVREQVAYLSTIVTLEPGDVIATGTPAGVGMARGVFLKPGDVMEAWLEDIGTLRNPVAAA